MRRPLFRSKSAVPEGEKEDEDKNGTNIEVTNQSIKLCEFPKYVDPMDMGYYYGLPGNPTLLAKSQKKKRRPGTYLEEETGIYRIQGKRVYEVEDTEDIGEVEDSANGPTCPIRECHKRTKEEISDKITDIVIDKVGSQCLGVDIKRIGFKNKPTDNPVVVLITLGMETSVHDAEWVRDVILGFLKVNAMNYEVEVMQREKYEELPVVQVLTPPAKLSEELEEIPQIDPPGTTEVSDGERRRSLHVLFKDRLMRRPTATTTVKAEEKLPTDRITPPADSNADRRGSLPFLSNTWRRHGKKSKVECKEIKSPAEENYLSEPRRGRQNVR